MIQVKIKMSEGFEHLLPKYETPGSAAFDCKAAITETIYIPAGERRIVSLEITTEIPEGYAAFLYPRSGLGAREGLIPANCVGVVDHDYRGKWSAVMLNTNPLHERKIDPGDRIVQAVIQKIEQVELVESNEFSETTRGTGGYGSTGK